MILDIPYVPPYHIAVCFEPPSLARVDHSKPVVQFSMVLLSNVKCSTLMSCLSPPVGNILDPIRYTAYLVLPTASGGMTVHAQHLAV